MADLVRSLRQKKERIESVIREQDRREGEMKALMDRLKSEFSLESYDEVKQRLQELGKELDDNEDTMCELDKEMDQILADAENAKRGSRD